MEEKPDVTYADVGGCKDQIEKLREVVETPLLHVIFSAFISTLTSFIEISLLKVLFKIIFIVLSNFLYCMYLINFVIVLDISY